MTAKTCTVVKKWAETHGHWVHFQHRDTMRRKRPMAKATLPETVPATTLPVDCSGNGTVSCPMDSNDSLGICGPAMCDHVDGLRSYGQGKAGFAEIHANLAALVAQYESISGGDNGTDEDMLVGNAGGPNGAAAPGIWLAGIANDPTAVVADHLDVDVTDLALCRYAIDQFYAVCMAWSVPDDFLKNFAQATVWAAADTPDPNNGHYTPLTDVDTRGFYRLYTWGSWCWAGPDFIASVQPQSFVTFSSLQFSKATGYDSHGRHVSDQAAKWVAIGGDAAKVAVVVAMFPAKPGPTPPLPVPAPNPPHPVPVPPPAPPPPAPPAVTLAQAQQWASLGLKNHWPAGSP